MNATHLFHRASELGLRLEPAGDRLAVIPGPASWIMPVIPEPAFECDVTSTEPELVEEPF